MLGFPVVHPLKQDPYTYADVLSLQTTLMGLSYKELVVVIRVNKYIKENGKFLLFIKTESPKIRIEKLNFYFKNGLEDWARVVIGYGIPNQNILRLTSTINMDERAQLFLSISQLIKMSAKIRGDYLLQKQKFSLNEMKQLLWSGPIPVEDKIKKLGQYLQQEESDEIIMLLVDSLPDDSLNHFFSSLMDLERDSLIRQILQKYGNRLDNNLKGRCLTRRHEIQMGGSSLALLARDPTVDPEWHRRAIEAAYSS